MHFFNYKITEIILNTISSVFITSLFILIKILFDFHSIFPIDFGFVWEGPLKQYFLRIFIRSLVPYEYDGIFLFYLVSVLLFIIQFLLLSNFLATAFIRVVHTGCKNK